MHKPKKYVSSREYLDSDVIVAHCVAVGFEYMVDLCFGGFSGSQPPGDIYNREIEAF